MPVQVGGGGGRPLPPPTYNPPTPSALLRPGTDYQVGVDPFLATGLARMVVTPNMAIPGTPYTSDSQGSITMNVAGTTLHDLYLPTGQVLVRADSCSVLRTEAAGWLIANSAGTAKRLFDAMSITATNALFQDCTARRGAYAATGIWDGFGMSASTTFRRCNAVGTTDCLAVFNSTSGHQDEPITLLVDGCDFSRMAFMSKDSAFHAGDSDVPKTHNDCIQIQGAGPGSSLEIRYSWLSAFCDPTWGPDILLDGVGGNVSSSGGYNPRYPYQQSNAGIQITQGQSTFSGLNLHHCWGEGGGQFVNTGAAQGPYANFGTIDNLKVAKNNYPGVPLSQRIQVPISVGGVNTTGATITNLTNLEDGTSFTAYRPAS